MRIEEQREKSRERGKRYYYRHHEERLVAARLYRIKNRKRIREYQRENAWKVALKGKYGLSVEEYEKLLKDQNGACAICGLEETRRLAIDHDHETGRIRGLLCTTCNVRLGVIESDFLIRASEYLGHS